MTDENMLEEKCSCGASIKVVLPTSISAMNQRKELLARLDGWHARHEDCGFTQPLRIAGRIRPPAPNPPPPKDRE